MEDLLDMIIADESPSQISDKIKDMLFAKSAAVFLESFIIWSYCDFALPADLAT